MNRYEIKEPIWKTRSIGIAEHRLNNDLLVDIIYRNKDGQRVYPDTYIVREGKALNYPSQNIKGNKVYWIPISELEVYDQIKS